MRLIDADALREGWLEWDIYDTIEVNTVLYSIDDQPTINPERPKGKWVLIELTDDLAEWFDYRCSVCGKVTANQSPYCCICGAKMEE